jgi:hypothetical protein
MLSPTLYETEREKSPMVTIYTKDCEGGIILVN